MLTTTDGCDRQNCSPARCREVLSTLYLGNSHARIYTKTLCNDLFAIAVQFVFSRDHMTRSSFQKRDFFLSVIMEALSSGNKSVLYDHVKMEYFCEPVRKNENLQIRRKFVPILY